MSTFRDACRATARNTPAPDADEIRYVADALDAESENPNPYASAYYVRAERLRMFVEQTAKREQELRSAIADAADLDDDYQALLVDFEAGQKLVAAQAEIISQRARDLAELTDRLAREVHRSTTLASLLVDTLADLSDAENVEIKFIFGHDNGGIEPDVASDLATEVSK